MQRLLMIFLVCVSTLLPSVAHAWWQQDWEYRKQISIDTTAEGGAINERVGRVPLLVRLHTGNFQFDGVQDNGGDIRFVLTDDQTVLNHQVESFDPLMGMAQIWVDVPAVEAGQMQDIWMYYGNPDAPATSNGQVTFDPDYTLVYHFEGAAGVPARDTTAYSNQSQTSVVSLTDGVVGRAAQFTGGEPLMLPASPSLAVPAAGAFTFSAHLRADQPAGEQLIYARRDAGNSLLIGLDQGIPFVEVNGQRSSQGQPITAGQWQHLAMAASADQLVLYVNGRESSSLDASLPPMSTVTAIGGDIPGFTASATPVAEGRADETIEGEVSTGTVAGSQYTPFVGAIDEIRLSKTARPAALLQADFLAQGSDSRLVTYGVDEQQSGINFGGLGFLVNAVPFDAWIILAILAFMAIQTWVIMISKNRTVTRMAEANDEFRQAFSTVGTRLESLKDDASLAARMHSSSTWRLYEVAINELRTRREQGMDTRSLSSTTLDSIRASMDVQRTLENRQLSARLGILSNAIAGGPYIGLLGTVLGIMVVFLGTAMAGDVNINAIAPGMAAALLATAAGLFVAIPALFGYNRLTGRNREISSDMRIFVDEFVTRLAEVHGGDGGSAVALAKHNTQPVSA
ncbi:biopolymer transport protein ExbB [Halopseudomonas litoralis]|uniref:Biopolymer transport protein ExbB n=1 Tax=Halopseudomonas litoralis TaxID=797277 RepID=A0A1H1Q6M4_9GAMM|nr:MotA/TolQ/ExbB proton channel family protein [Halopseudomonas litoralis]SDS19168.1 biopolymer transport protein ExbB [Halopseudomonas litoralis]